MKANKTLTILAFLFFIIGILNITKAAESGSLIVNFRYFMFNNKIPFVQVQSGVKIDKKYQPVPDISFQVYLDNIGDSSLIGKAKSDENGGLTIPIPKSLKTLWDASLKHTLICKSEATKAYEETEQELEITQAKLEIDTLNDGTTRSIVATLMEKTDKGWVPVPETDLKVGVKRLGGILSAGSDETFTTDAEGKATAAFERDSLPGDQNGNLTLIAKLEDNDMYGNLVVETNANWGVKASLGLHNTYNDRTLFSTRFKAPYWLLFIANSIIILVWGTIIYLAFQVLKIRRLGRETS